MFGNRCEYSHLGVVLFLLVIAPFCSGQVANEELDGTLKGVDELFAHYNNSTPGVAVAIALNGEKIYDKAYGIADLEHNVPVTTNSIFECGSVSKQFTAMAVLLLIQDGELSLNDDIRHYLPEMPHYGSPITIYHLLGHTSGLRDWGEIYDLAGWPRTTRVYSQELSYDIIVNQKSLNFHPGSSFLYSNSNYVLLTLIVERVSGKSLQEFTSERIFRPLGMKNTLWRNNFREVVKDRAIAYSAKDDAFQQLMPFEDVYGPGGLLTTTEDLLIWNQLLEDPRILTRHTSELRLNPSLLNDEKSTGYAAGLYIKKWCGYTEISHSGATAGYRAYLGYYPEKKLSIALLSNDASFATNLTGHNVASLFLGTEDEQQAVEAENEETLFVPEVNIIDYAGIYRSDEADVTFRLEVIEGKLSASRRPGDLVNLRAAGHDQFNAGVRKYEFLRDRKGRITGFNVSGPRAYNIPFVKLTTRGGDNSLQNNYMYR